MALIRDKIREGLTELPASAVRPALWILGVSLAGLVASGVPLIWQYHPSRRLPVQEFHVVAAMVLVAAALVLAIATGWARLKRQRTVVGWLAGVGLLVLVLVGRGSGQVLAWDGLVLNRPIDQPELTGISDELDIRGLSVATDPGVLEITVADGTMTPDAFKQMIAVHLVVLPLVGVVVLSLSARLQRRRGSEGQVEDTP